MASSRLLPSKKCISSFTRSFSNANKTAARKKLNICVVDSYAPESRIGFKEYDMPLAGELYSDMLKTVAARGVDVDTTIIYPADEDFEIPDISGYDGLAFSGSSYSVYDTVPGVKKQIQLTHQAFAERIPCFGSCWGLQILASAAGGSVQLNPRGREYGIGRKLSLTLEGRAHPLFEGKKSTFDAFISHSDEVVHLPPNAINLAGNDHSRVQALVLNINNCEHWAVQYHPEYTLDYIATMTISRTERLLSMGFFASEKDLLNFAEDLHELAKDNSRFDLKWKYGIDDDILDPNIRQVEPRNWIKRLAQQA